VGHGELQRDHCQHQPHGDHAGPKFLHRRPELSEILGSGTGAVTINPGSFNGTLTVGGGGISMATGASTPDVINANVVLGSSQTWTVTDAGSALAVNGNISGAFGITKTGAGALTLGGFNTFTGGVTLSAGALNINNGGSTTTNSALGTGTLTIAAGTTLNNTSGVSQALLTTGAETWNGNFTYTGSSSLSLGTGAVTLAGSTQVTVSGDTLVVGGVIGPASAFTLTKSGPGALTLSGANTFTGGVNLSQGTLNINSAAALGAVGGAFVISGSNGAVAIDNTSGALVTTSTYTAAQQWNANFTFNADAPLSFGPSPVTLGTSPTITVNGPGTSINTNALTVAGIISGATQGLTKTGPGSLILSGVNTYGSTTGQTISLNQGTLSFGNAAALGSTHNTFTITGSAGAVAIDASAATTLSNYSAMNWNADFAFVGTAALTTGVPTSGITLGVASGGMRTITNLNVLNNGSALIINGVIENTNTPALTINGPGTVTLAAADLYTGATTVNAGSTLNLGGGTAAGSLASTSLVMNGGTFTYTVTGTNTQAFAGGVSIGGGANVFTDTVSTDTLTLNGISRTPGATVDFTTLTGGVTTTTINTNGILGGWATATGGASWAVGSSAGSATPITALATGSYTASIATTAAAPGAALNVDFQASNTGSWATGAVNTLRFNQTTGQTLTIAPGATLTITSGGILTTPTSAAANNLITGGTISAGATDLIINQWDTSGNLTINSIISGTGGLTRSGGGATNTGATILGGALDTAVAGSIQNSLSGGIFINDGILQANGSNVTGGKPRRQRHGSAGWRGRQCRYDHDGEQLECRDLHGHALAGHGWRRDRQREHRFPGQQPRVECQRLDPGEPPRPGGRISRARPRSFTPRP
jgi:fibronectin-binding autotransporter adhesin